MPRHRKMPVDVNNSYIMNILIWYRFQFMLVLVKYILNFQINFGFKINFFLLRFSLNSNLDFRIKENES